MLKKYFYVYILASESGTLYIGVTNDLKRRIWEHQHDLVKGFSQKYGCHKLVYFDSQKSPMYIGQNATNLPAGRQGNKLLRRNVGVPRQLAAR